MAITNIYKGNVERSDIQKIYKGTTLLYERVPPIENYVRFVSASARTITPRYTNSGITLQYSVNKGATWTTISSGSSTTSSTEHWFRGQATEGKKLFTNNVNTNAWTFSGDSSNSLAAYGNLNYLLCDTLGDEVAPDVVGSYCYSYMFYNCKSLTIAPSLPATTLAYYCYDGMFRDCTSLTTPPRLPALEMSFGCYRYMFYACVSLHVSSTKTDLNIYPWRFPASGTGTESTIWNQYMLSSTPGDAHDTPYINRTYYVRNEPV